MNDDGHNLVQYLGITAGRTVATDEQPDIPADIPIGLVTFRLSPMTSYHPTCVVMTQHQLVRLRNDINRVLRDPQSWLFVFDDEFDVRNEIVPEGFNCGTTDYESPADP